MLKTIALIFIFAITATAQQWGGMFIGVDRSAPSTRYFNQVQSVEFRVSAVAVIKFQPNKRVYNLQFALIQPMADRPPVFRIGINTRLF